jgi:hypothetical protein
MFTRFLSVAVVVCAVLALTCSTAAAVEGLVHRYSFNDGTASDSAGTLNGTAMSGLVQFGSFSGNSYGPRPLPARGC